MAGVDDYLAKLKADALAQYPYLRQHDPLVFAGKGSDYAETYLPGDPGDADAPRDPRVPLDRAGVVVFKPDQFKASDLAAEGLHLDPYSKMIRQRLANELTENQRNHIMREPDYATSIERGMTPADALRNGVDSAMRGYVFNQWPEEDNARMAYTPSQLQLLGALHRYVTTGEQK